MKLYRFTAADNHRAILKAHESLGAEALIYSTRKTKNGVEVIAGLADDTACEGTNSFDVKNAETQHQMIESLSNQLQHMDSNIQRLSNDVISLNRVIAENMKKKRIFSLKFMKTFTRVGQFIKEGVYGRHATQGQ